MIETSPQMQCTMTDNRLFNRADEGVDWEKG